MTTAPPPTAPPAGLALAGAALCVLAALLIGFAADLTVVGHLQHAREQSTAYDDLREQPALGTAPVGQLACDGKPLAPGAPWPCSASPRSDSARSSPRAPPPRSSCRAPDTAGTPPCPAGPAPA